MAVKEKDLPVASGVGASDYLRVVDSSGSSKKASGSYLYTGLIELNTSASPGTTDGDLYAAIVALGWQNDVIE